MNELAGDTAHVHFVFVAGAAPFVALGGKLDEVPFCMYVRNMGVHARELICTTGKRTKTMYVLTNTLAHLHSVAP